MVSVNDNVIFYADWQALLRVVRYIKVFPTEDLFWSSVFWGSMAYVLIGGTAVGTVLTLAFLPALYAISFRVNRKLN